MKKNVIIVILIIIILGLGGYLVYDKLLINDNLENETAEQENTNTQEQDKVNNVLSDEEAYSIGQELYDYGHRVLWCQEYKYSSYQYVQDLGYEVLNYEEVKSKFTSDNLVQHNYLAEFNSFDIEIVESNGKYYDKSMCGRGSDQSYISTKLKLLEKKDNEIVFNAISEYCDVSLMGVDNDISKCDIETKTYEFKITKEDGEWKIAKMTNPN